MGSIRKRCISAVLAAMVLACCFDAVCLGQTEQKSKQVDWNLTGGSRIRAIHYPQGSRAELQLDRQQLQPTTYSSAIPTAQADGEPAIWAITVDSPPIGGFVPWIAVAATDKHEAQFDTEVIPQNSVTGMYLAQNPQTDYVIGIFDTGASAHIINHAAAEKLGMLENFVTENIVSLGGATGSIDAMASFPLGMFIDGIDAIEPNGLLLDDSGMVGQSNVVTVVGKQADPNLPVAIGAPLSVFYTAEFRNDISVSRSQGGQTFTGPDITLYPYDSPATPNYYNEITLELRPSNVGYVQYWPCLDFLFDCPSGDGSPQLPTIIVDGMWVSQGVFFVQYVNLADETYSTTEKQKFLFDTGAQVSVISTGIAALVGLDTGQPEFEVEIQGVNGQITLEPGFYLDRVEIPADGQWLRGTNVPVIVLNVNSPEGGYFDGIIGMNLFGELNFAFHGGGLPIQGMAGPRITFEPTYILADIAPQQGDGAVDTLDLIRMTHAWLGTPIDENWDENSDIAPQPLPDEIVDLLDFATLAEHWLKGTTP